MDWDVEPTAFDEFVTIDKGTSPVLLYTNNDGFATANPLGSRESGVVDPPLVTGSFTDEGPRDHGALFDFDFGELLPGESKSFFTYYGAAADEIDALGAIGQVQAEAYSIGQPNTAGGSTQGTPNTFIFAFRGLTEVESAPEGTDLNGHPNSGTSDDPVHTFTGSSPTPSPTSPSPAAARPSPSPAPTTAMTRGSDRSNRAGPTATPCAWPTPGTAPATRSRRTSGSQHRYTRNPDGSFSPPPAIYTSLVQETDGTYSATHKDRSVWRFDAGGRLTAVVDRHGNTSALTYDGSGHLIAIATRPDAAR